jgi:hypothetical protein
MTYQNKAKHYLLGEGKMHIRYASVICSGREQIIPRILEYSGDLA